jgi:NAD(P)-dependent dehydrogenase (short-subunit alcohol dehydrogenase family)
MSDLPFWFSSVSALYSLPECVSSLFAIFSFTALCFLSPSSLVFFILSIFILTVSRLIARGGRCSNARQFPSGHVSLVTGAASGIGYCTARELGRYGSTVIIAIRGQARADKIASQLTQSLGLPMNSNRFIGIDMDLSSFSSILQSSRDLQKRFSTLNLLVNNAGIMMCPYTISVDGLELQMATNHFGHFYLTHQLLPLLEKAGGRVVNVSSIAHWFAPNGINLESQRIPSSYDPTVAYGMSKLANLWFSRELNRRYQNRGIRSFALHPGVVATELGRHTPLLKLLFAIRLVFFKTPAEGAQTSLHCCFTDESPALFYADCAPAPCSKWAQDAEEAKRFWDISDKIVKERTARLYK